MQPLEHSQRMASVKHATRTIAVTGGKGGVGKTSMAVNLAAALAQKGERVLLLDGDLGLANIDVQLGLTPHYTLQHVLSGERELCEIVQCAAERLFVIPAASGVARMARLTPTEQAAIIQAFASLTDRFDTLIIDTAAGIGDSVLQFAAAAEQVLVVLCDEPASLTDAYGLIKVLNRECGVKRCQVLTNRTMDAADGDLLFRRLQRVTDRYLEVQLLHLGDVPDDPLLIKANRSQRTLLSAYPGAPASRALARLAAQIQRWPRCATSSGRIEFFFERLHAQRGRRLQVVK
jgi:flagellar biosynthesis protein FlhG